MPIPSLFDLSAEIIVKNLGYLKFDKLPLDLYEPLIQKIKDIKYLGILRYCPQEESEMLAFIRKQLDAWGSTSRAPDKIRYADICFKTLVLNPWFIQKHEKFKKTIDEKLKEFFFDKNYKEQSNEFYYLIFGTYLEKNE